MVNQQVNLFQPSFRKERKVLSFRALLQISLAVVVLLMGMYGWAWQQSYQIQNDLFSMRAQFEEKTGQIAGVGSRIAGEGENEKHILRKELAALERKLLAQRKTVTELAEVGANSGGGVSEYMASFSRQSPKGVWLRGFSVEAGGDVLTIHGSSLKPSLIPEFLQRLSSEPSLAGVRFGMLQIEREATSEDYVNFVVYTGSKLPGDEIDQ